MAQLATYKEENKQNQQLLYAILYFTNNKLWKTQQNINFYRKWQICYIFL